MKTVILLLAICAVIGIARAADVASLGYCEDTILVDDQSDTCIGALIQNHDSSFENAYCWQDAGCAPPYYGAWGEGFHIDTGTIECAVFWLTDEGQGMTIPTDVYIWECGVTSDPSSVLCLIPGVHGLFGGFWPTCRRNDVQINCCSSGDFTVGYWADWSPGYCYWYSCVDENGPGGHPWTNIAPGIGYPTGWQHPNVIWPNCRSLGIGATIIETPSPAESRTWGSIKALFE